MCKYLQTITYFQRMYLHACTNRCSDYKTEIIILLPFSKTSFIFLSCILDLIKNEINYESNEYQHKRIA